MTAETIALAERFMRALEANDVDTIRACYAPDAAIWHNFDGETQTVEQNMRTLGWVDKKLKNRRYEIVARQIFPGGYVQQHVLNGTLADGTAFRMPACVVVSVENGRIAKLEEYLDSAHVEPLLRA